MSELLYRLTYKNSSFRRTNLKNHFTADPFSLTNTLIRRDGGYLLNNATALSLEGEKVKKIKKTTKRLQLKNKKRLGA